MLKKIKASIDNITKSSNDVISRFEAIDSSVKTVSEHEQNIRSSMEEQEEGGKQILESVSRLKELTSTVKNGAIDMSNSGDELIKKTNEFVGISNEVIKGMNDIFTGAMTEIQTAVKQVEEMSVENENNFIDLKTETEKFKISTGDKKKIILTVDDDEIHLAITNEMLKEKYEVVTAKSGQEAITLFFRGLVPSLILLDLIMPEMDGWDTYERIKAIGNFHDIPIAFFTSSDDLKDRNRASKMGAVDFINKPAQQDELQERVRKIINN
jgi:CheY-like chemotaxis protein